MTDTRHEDLGISAELKRLARRLTHKKVLEALALITIGGFGGFIGGYTAGNPDYIKIQQSARVTETAYFGYLQQALDKLADVSQNKSAKVVTAGFDTLASVFKAANDSATVLGQYQELCDQTSMMDFQHTATKTGNMNISIYHQMSCNYYQRLATDYNLPLNSDTLLSLTPDFTDVAFNLLKLDNTIEADP